MKKILFFALSSFFLVLAPLFSFWWVFVPVAVLAVIFSRNAFPPIIAGFVLDIIYSGEGDFLPVLTIFGLGLSILSLIFRDKLRF